MVVIKIVNLICIWTRPRDRQVIAVDVSINTVPQIFSWVLLRLIEEVSKTNYVKPNIVIHWKSKLSGQNLSEDNQRGPLTFYDVCDIVIMCQPLSPGEHEGTFD